MAQPSATLNICFRLLLAMVVDINTCESSPVDLIGTVSIDRKMLQIFDSLYCYLVYFNEGKM